VTHGGVAARMARSARRVLASSEQLEAHCARRSLGASPCSLDPARRSFRSSRARPDGRVRQGRQRVGPSSDLIVVGYDREPDTMNRYSTHILEDIQSCIIEGSSRRTRR
jgi:hypothetical protein